MALHANVCATFCCVSCKPTSRYRSAEYPIVPALTLAWIQYNRSGKSVTFGVTRGCIEVASPVSSITWLIPP